MERFKRYVIALTPLLLSYLAPLPCNAQTPAPAAKATEVAAPTRTNAGETTQAPQPTTTAPRPMRDDQTVKLKPPPVEATEIPLPINLATALRLADARPLVVAAAQASAWVAEAQLQRAKLLWVPELDLDFVYIRHDGFGPDFNRGNNPPYSPTSQMIPINNNINYMYAGGGLYQVIATTDAVFAPLAARQVLNSRRWDIQTARNSALLDTAQAYFRVHQHRGTYAGALDVVQRGQRLVDRVSRLSEDLVPKAEVDRARRTLADAEQRAASAREEWRVASADLTQVLRLDPRAVIVPTEHDHLQLTLIDPARSIDDLIPIGLTNRPELASQQALVQAVLVRIRQEKLRPILPSILLTGFQTPGGMRMQGGIFGTGNANTLNLWSLRNDVSIQFVWQLEGLGFGNLARIKERRGEQSRTVVELFKMQDAVAAEVSQTQANLQAAAVRVVQAERSVREALDTYDKNYEGLRQTKRFANILIQIYRPQEAVEALEHLGVSYNEYFTTVADYNRAQFQMFHALGYPANEVTIQNPPGEIIPVDTTRPAFLPPVGTGPPPATR